MFRSVWSCSRKVANSSLYISIVKMASLPVVLHIPNVLCYIRILLGFWGLVLSTAYSSRCSSSTNECMSSQTTTPLKAIGIWVFSAILDLFDGILARWLKQTSQFGVLLDIVADNLLRSCTWMALAISAVTQHENLSNDFMKAEIIVLTSTMVLCLEWCTMIATQLHASSHQQHWKEARANDPWMVRQYFANNFGNPIGTVGIYGLFTASLFAYGSFYNVVYENIPYFSVWRYLAYAGRALSASIEVYFCTSYLSVLLKSEVMHQKDN